ncbi:MAG: peptidase M6, partial [Prevotellaceae bacterium]|nr:peptidase M6 [Prevotellaceae bacterium]
LKITNPEEENEYFLLENIQHIGWGQKMPATGLLVYHVNEKNVSAIHIDTHLNNVAGQPGMAVVPADGALLSSYIVANRPNYLASLKGDLFAGPNNITILNDTLKLPNFFWFNGTNPLIATGSSFHKVNKALKNITNSGGNISFDFINDFTTGIHTIRKQDIPVNEVYSIDGRYMGKSLHNLPAGVYIYNKKKVVIK